MKLKQLFSALLCLAILACCAPIALAAEDSATVTFWFSNGDEITTAFDLTVTDGTAESFGYTVAEKDHNDAAIETVTAMDVLVAAHKAVYGDAFTKDTANDYLTVNTGFMTKAFGLSTSNLGFAVNDATLHDDTFVETYNGYTGYAIDTARVHDGDRICLYTIRDPYWSDVLPLFDKTSVETAEGEAFTLTVSGYSAVYYGCCTQETIDRNTSPLEGVKVECTQDFKTFTEVGTLDADGKLSVTLPDVGTYYLVVRGEFDDADQGELPLIASFCKVDVKEPEPNTSNAKYFPVCVRPVFSFADHTLTLGVAVKFRDLKKTAPDKTETFIFSISLRFFVELFKK